MSQVPRPASPPARIVGLGTPAMTAGGLVDLRLDHPNTRLPVEVAVDLKVNPDQVRAEVWSNAGENKRPDRYTATPMALIGQEGRRALFRAEVPVDRVGNYRLTARVRTDDGQVNWANTQGIGDLRFRPRPSAHHALNMMELNVGMANYDAKTGKPGTFADLMESGSPKTNGRYTLEWLKELGVNAIWMQPVFPVEKWDQRPASDTAGSPYAVKDYFSVRSELSRGARALGDEGPTLSEPQRQAAIDEFKAFVQRCDQLGIKVILDVALNHVGHDYVFRDLFVTKDGEGRETRQVKLNEFSKVARDPEQRAAIAKRLAEPSARKFMEHLAPFMYGKFPDPRGAGAVDQIAPGGWFEWHDTKQLNHGRMRWGYRWWDLAPNEVNEAVVKWLTRILKFWAVDVGVHGFRLDHLTGLPERFLERALNKVQATVDRHHPLRGLFFMGEDFHTGDRTRHWLDFGQGGWFHDFVRARSPEDFKRVVDHPHFHDLLSVGSHDEERFTNRMGGDLKAAARLSCILLMLGGPVLHVMGDEFGERENLEFKQYKGVRSLRAAGPEALQMAELRARAGRARAHPALATTERTWLKDHEMRDDPRILAFARLPREGDRVVVAVANLDNAEAHTNVFRLGRDVAARLDPEAHYQVRDLLSKDQPGLWPSPKRGSELIEGGLYVEVAPYQVQALALERA